MTIKCDWLDVTYAPDDTPDRAVALVVQSAGASARNSGAGATAWELDGGLLLVDYRRTFARFSASGRFLDGLRAAGVYMDYLSALSESPHTITRLDAAYDLPTDAADVLAALHKAYPVECRLSRKALRTKRILETRPDGRESGTWYAGHKQKGMVTARVYDKQLEQASKGVELPLPLTRYELTFRKAVGATLRDAAEPASLFWAYGERLLLERPEGVPDWVSGWGGGWSYEREDTPIPGLLKQRIESSAEIQALAALAVRGDCVEWAERLLARIFRGHATGAGMLGDSEDAA